MKTPLAFSKELYSSLPCTLRSVIFSSCNLQSLQHLLRPILLNLFAHEYSGMFYGYGVPSMLFIKNSSLIAAFNSSKN